MFQEISSSRQYKFRQHLQILHLWKLHPFPAEKGGHLDSWIPRGDMDNASEREPESEEEEVDDNDNETTSTLQEMNMVSFKLMVIDCD